METRGCLGLPWWWAGVGGAKASLQLRRPCRGLMTVPRGVMNVKEQRNHVLSYNLKVKGWKKIFHTNRDQKKAGVAILI